MRQVFVFALLLVTMAACTSTLAAPPTTSLPAPPAPTPTPQVLVLTEKALADQITQQYAQLMAQYNQDQTAVIDAFATQYKGQVLKIIAGPSRPTVYAITFQAVDGKSYLGLYLNSTWYLLPQEEPALTATATPAPTPAR